MLLLSASLFWSISNLIMKRVQGVNFLHFMVWVCLVPPIPLLTLSYYFESQEVINILILSSPKTWFSLSYVSYISTLIVFTIWGFLLKTYEAAVVTPFAFLIPIVGIFSSNILLREHLSFFETIGTIFVLLGLFISVLGTKVFNFLKNNKLFI